MRTKSPRHWHLFANNPGRIWWLGNTCVIVRDSLSLTKPGERRRPDGEGVKLACCSGSALIKLFTLHGCAVSRSPPKC